MPLQSQAQDFDEAQERISLPESLQLQNEAPVDTPAAPAAPAAPAVIGMPGTTIERYRIPQEQDRPQRPQEQNLQQAPQTEWGKKQQQAQQAIQSRIDRGDMTVEEGYALYSEYGFDQEVNPRFPSRNVDDSRTINPNSPNLPTERLNIPEASISLPTVSNAPGASQIHEFNALSYHDKIELAQEFNINPETEKGINAIAEVWNKEQYQDDVGAIIAAADNFFDYTATLAYLNISDVDTSIMNVEGQKLETLEGTYKQAVNILGSSIVNTLGKQGITAKYDIVPGILNLGFDYSISVQDPTSKEWEPMSSSILQALGATKFYMGGMVAGGIAGAKLASKIPPVPFSQLAKVGAIIGGAAIGGAAGDQVDAMMSAHNLGKDYAYRFNLDRLMGVAARDAAIDLSIGGIGLGAKGAYLAAKWLVTGKDTKALRFIKDVYNVSDTEANNLVNSFKSFMKDTQDNSLDAFNSYNPAQQFISTVSRSGKLSGEMLNFARIMDNSAGAGLRDQFTTIAKELSSNITPLKAKELGWTVLADLASHEQGVKAYMAKIQAQGKQNFPNFTWTTADLGIEPKVKVSQKILKRNTSKGEVITHETTTTTTDPLDIQSRVVHTLKELDAGTSTEEMYSALTSVTSGAKDLLEKGDFGSFLELSNRLKHFQRTKRISGDTVDYIGSILVKMNDKIQESAETPEAAQWIENWQKAKRQQLELANLAENNPLYRKLIPAITEDLTRDDMRVVSLLQQGRRNLDNAYTSEDLNHYEMIAKHLAPKTRIKVENLLLDTVVQEFTHGKSSARDAHTQIINFYGLNRQLERYNFKTTRALKTKKLVKRFSQIYSDNFDVFATLKNIHGIGEQIPIATSIEGKAKQTLLKYTWAKLAKNFPGQEGNLLNLSDQVAKLLKDPLDAGIAKKYLKAIDDDEVLTQATKDFIAQAAKFPPEDNIFRQLYWQGGKLYTRKKGSRTIKTDEQVAEHHIINGEAVKKAFNLDKLTYTSLSKIHKAQLLQLGFKAVELENGQLIPIIRLD